MIDIKELPSEPVWSSSRSDLFAQCLRAYYIRYYLSWNGWLEDADPRSRRAWFLTKLDNRWTWTGRAVHEAIADWFKTREDSGDGGINGVMEGMVAKLRDEYRLSLSGAYKNAPGKVVGLLEHEMREALSKEDWAGIVENAKTCIRNFFQSDNLRFVRDVPRRDIHCVENSDKFEVVEGFECYVVVDFAYRAEDYLVVLDWKTGRRERKEIERQLLCYASYFEKKGWPVDRIGTAAVYLLKGKVSRVEVTRDKLNEFSDGVVRDLRMMREMHGAGESEFPASPSRLCGWCRYRELCNT